MPKDTIKFGFPDEIGSFAFMVALGLGWQEVIPNIQRYSLESSRLKNTDNLHIKIVHEINPNSLFLISNKLLKNIVALRILRLKIALHSNQQ